MRLLRKRYGTLERRSHLYRRRHTENIFYNQVKKSRSQVIMAQGAKCQNIGIVELNVRIREFEKPWLFHMLADLECPCILGVDFISVSKIILDFDRKSLAIPDSQIDKEVKTFEEEKVEIDLSKTKFDEKQKQELQNLFNSFRGLFSDKTGLTHVLHHDIDMGDNRPVVSRPYRYDRVKQAILDYYVDKMLKEGTIIPIHSPYASPVVLCRKNNGLPPDNPEAYRFAVDYRKLNAITKYPHYPLPLIDDLIMNIPNTAIMLALDLRSGYFQLAVNPSDIAKPAFVAKNGTYAFCRMSFGSSGAAPNFQAIDILKPVILKVEHRPRTQNAVADVLSRNPVESIIGENVSCAIIRDLVLSSIEQLIEEQKTDPELGHIYKYLETPEDTSVNAILSGRLIPIVSNYPNETVTFDLLGPYPTSRFLREFAYAIRAKVKEKTGKTPAELFLGRKLITPFQKLVMVSDGTEFAVGDIERLTTPPFSSATKKVVAKFKQKIEGPYRVLEVKNNNVVIWKAVKRSTVNIDQVRIYRHRKCDEIEIRTSSSDSNSSRHESSSFDRVQRISNESQYGRKKGRDSNTHHKRLQPQTTKWKKSGVPTNHGDEETTRRTSSSQEKQMKELQPLHRRAEKIRQQEYQTKSSSVNPTPLAHADNQRYPPKGGDITRWATRILRVSSLLKHDT
ncbi:retrovirus-related Pol polyprotein from transposon 297 [Trichonephila clavipes]|nr:retrovirus-related Pol polyprotein from transposon 297 [Trichonephila clavipes]